MTHVFFAGSKVRKDYNCRPMLATKLALEEAPRLARGPLIQAQPQAPLHTGSKGRQPFELYLTFSTKSKRAGSHS